MNPFAPPRAESPRPTEQTPITRTLAAIGIIEFVGGIAMLVFSLFSVAVGIRPNRYYRYDLPLATTIGLTGTLIAFGCIIAGYALVKGRKGRIHWMQVVPAGVSAWFVYDLVTAE